MRPLACTLLAVVAGASLLVSGCGGESAEDILRDTFGGDKDVRSGKVAIDLTVNAQGGQAPTSGPITVKLTGPFQSRGERQMPQFDLSASLTGGGQTRSAGAVTTGEKGWIRVQDDVYEVPADVFAQFKQGFEQAQRQSGGDDDTSLGALGIDPLKWLEDPEVEDDEKIGGVDTKHVSAGVDKGKFLEDVNKLLNRARQQGGQQGQLPAGGITPQQREQFENAVKDIRFDVWSGKDDKVLRKLSVTLDFDVPQGQAAPSGLQRGSLAFVLTLTDLNQPQTIAEPVNAKPFSELTKQLEGLLGGLGGGTRGGGSGGARPPGGPAPGGGGSDDRAQDYIECINRAGGDVEKAQKCADLLNP